MARRKEGWKVLTVEVPVELAERLKAQAKSNHRSVSGEVVAVLEQNVAATPAGSNGKAKEGGK